LTKAGLIRRKNGIYYLTSFGKVIYNYHLEIETALSYHWKLEALDSILLSQSSDKAKIPLEEKVNLVEKLIDNHKIRDIISPIISNNNTSADNVVHRTNEPHDCQVRRDQPQQGQIQQPQQQIKALFAM
jgi:organic radical activating enzyme